MYVDLIGYAAGAVTAFCFVPQIWQTLKTGHAEDISWAMLLLLLMSGLLYEIYAMLLGLWPVVVMNGIFTVLVAFELGLKTWFELRARPQPASAVRQSPS